MHGSGIQMAQTMWHQRPSSVGLRAPPRTGHRLHTASARALRAKHPLQVGRVYLTSILRYQRPSQEPPACAKQQQPAPPPPPPPPLLSWGRLLSPDALLPHSACRTRPSVVRGCCCRHVSSPHRSIRGARQGDTVRRTTASCDRGRQCASTRSTECSAKLLRNAPCARLQLDA